MILECTKKLLDALGQAPAKSVAVPPVDPLFAWTANLIMTGRRKTIVVVHQASRCMFVLYGITVKHMKKLPELLIEGIRALLQSEYIHPDIIEKYLDDCGRDVVYTTNSSRSVVALGNKACECVQIYAGLFEAENLYQKMLLPWLNDYPNPKADYQLCYKLLRNLLSERYGENVVACPMVELDVELQLETPCRRTIAVPANLNFYQLHRILQKAFGWKDCHLHQFTLPEDPEEKAVPVIRPYDEDMDDIQDSIWLDSVTTEVGSLCARYPEILYEYDFGDNWQHTLRVKRFFTEAEKPYPYCIEAVGDAPMEDCGGPSGFAEIMSILQNPAHPAYAETDDWVKSTGWVPMKLEEINRWIDLVYRVCMPVE